MMTVITMIIPVSILFLLILVFGLSIFGGSVHLIHNKKQRYVISGGSFLVLAIATAVVGYQFLRPQLEIARAGDQLLARGEDMLTDHINTENAIKVDIGEFEFAPTDFDVMDEVFNDQGGLPVTLENTADFPVSVYVTIEAVDEEGQVIDTMSTGSRPAIEPGEKVSLVLFNGFIEKADVERFKNASFREVKSERISIRSNFDADMSDPFAE